MVPLADLEFAQKFPFSETGKRIVKSLDVRLGGEPDGVKSATAERISAASRKQAYFQKNLEGHQELLEAEVLSYTLAKVFLSIINNSKLYALFAKSNADTAFALLEAERGSALKIRLAQEFGIEFDLAGEKLYSVKVSDYLSASLGPENTKLVNQGVENGSVLLNEERFSRFLSGLALKKIRESLPLPVEGIPESVKRDALVLGEKYREKQRAVFRRMAGRVRAELFPPCMEKLYADLLAGKNVSHLARFDLTAFLNAVGMPATQIAESFKSAPNYNEKTTKYQIRKITKGGRQGRGYSPASCATLKTHALCIAGCSVKHPAQFYRKELYKAGRQAKGGGKGEQDAGKGKGEQLDVGKGTGEQPERGKGKGEQDAGKGKGEQDGNGAVKGVQPEGRKRVGEKAGGGSRGGKV